MSSSKTDTEVIIGGKVFTLCGYESEEYLQKVASYINNKIVEYGKVESFRRQNVDMQNILLQLNIADDYFKGRCIRAVENLLALSSVDAPRWGIAMTPSMPAVRAFGKSVT